MRTVLYTLDFFKLKTYKYINIQKKLFIESAVIKFEIKKIKPNARVMFTFNDWNITYLKCYSDLNMY